MTRQYQIPKKTILTAWKAVCRADGSAGYDGKTIADVKGNLEGELYKIWNRMSSGSYMAPPVKLIQIPKTGGGQRTLGIPTVTDRIAQTVVKMMFEPLVENKFHQDSYAYRPNRSAIDAVGKARERCFRKKWVLDMDIKGFFDALDHNLIMEMVEKYTKDKMILLYVKRFIKAKGLKDDGSEIERDMGTPQGGVVSPVIANLYLHEALDSWLEEEFPKIEFERYADDCIVHCENEAQAYYMKNQIEERLKQFKLTLHPDKTKIVYVGPHGKRDKIARGTPRKFTYLGFDFKPRQWKLKTVFTPAIGQKAKKLLREKMRLWGLKHQCSAKIEEIAQQINAVIRGWIQYYGSYRRSSLYAVANDIDHELVRWLKQKFKSTKSYKKSWKRLQDIMQENPKLFCHWYLIKSPSKSRMN